MVCWLSPSMIVLADNPHGFLVIALIVLSFTVIAGWIALRTRD